jgi:hypothetical protein
MSENITVTMDHAYACGWCATGVRRVLRQHDMDYRKFFREGLPIEQFDAVEDHMFQLIAKEARHGR